MEFKFEHNKKRLTATLVNIPFKSAVFVDETLSGEPYATISTRLVANDLLDAIWVKKGGIEQELANKVPFLRQTPVETKGGMNVYIKYDLILP